LRKTYKAVIKSLTGWQLNGRGIRHQYGRLRLNSQSNHTKNLKLVTQLLSLRARQMKHGGCLFEWDMLSKSRSSNGGIKCVRTFYAGPSL